MRARSDATDIRFRAEIRAGELQQGGERQGQSQPKKLKSHNTTLKIPKLSDFDVSKMQQPWFWTGIAAGVLTAALMLGRARAETICVMAEQEKAAGGSF
jgi:hypothetical protein